ncbi:P-loop containing nucleoside triphosphate hydrolase protein [Polyporus arcularius HHB13444]|uniref:P-loop containing nucleoside triphosphate hydrolase protein n=1 Tax=Polyporus arcularius HHB13444 TaxID=1314778 RepID=A0A5C3PXJ8_9APHY|nr:P-loop containing nucleoside triphosphate hydrolase protein [Polyporus arcularius HHB13444]
MPCLWRPPFSTLSLSTLRRYTTHPVVLRPYQESCLDACLDALKKGATRIGVSLPTGAGKTTVFISLLSRLAAPVQAPKATRALVIVNSVELAQQTADQAKRLFPDWSVEIEQGKHHASGLADLTVATFQTLLRAQRLEKFRAQYLKALIVDEAHHAAAPSYRRILSHFDAGIKSPDQDFEPPELSHKIPILGFSATFSRHDGLALGSVFEEIVYHRDFLEMIKEQWCALCDVRFTTVRANIDLSEVTVNSRTGDFNPTSLAHVVNTDTVNELIVRTWLDKAADRKSTLIFCVNLSHVSRVTAAFRAAGIDARYLHSLTPAAERKALVEAFKAGQYPVLVNCAVLTEGADIPNIDCVMVARPTRSRNMFAQMIGRGMRLSPTTGKDYCRIIDFVESQERVGGVVSAPTLFGLDPSELSDDETIESLEERRAAIEASDGIDAPAKYGPSGHVPQPKSVTYIDHDDPFVLADQACGDPNLRSLSRNGWVRCGDDVYVLECLGKGYIRVTPAEDEDDVKYVAHYTSPTMPRMTAFVLKISPFRRNKKILTATTLADAIRGCDTYAQKEVLPGLVGHGLLRTAKWRWEPASETQKQFILKRWKARKVITDADGEGKSRLATEEGLKNMKKGEAANIITRLKHGAQARHEKMRKERLRTVLGVEKEKARRAREVVKVGPLAAAA